MHHVHVHPNTSHHCRLQLKFLHRDTQKLAFPSELAPLEITDPAPNDPTITVYTNVERITTFSLVSWVFPFKDVARYFFYSFRLLRLCSKWPNFVYSVCVCSECKVFRPFPNRFSHGKKEEERVSLQYLFQLKSRTNTITNTPQWIKEKKKRVRYKNKQNTKKKEENGAEMKTSPPFSHALSSVTTPFLHPHDTGERIIVSDTNDDELVA